MFVDDFGTPSSIVMAIVVVVCGSEERLKVGYEKETDLVLLFNVGDSKFAIVGSGYWNCCGWCSEQKGMWSSSVAEV